MKLTEQIHSHQIKCSSSCGQQPWFIECQRWGPCKSFWTKSVVLTGNEISKLTHMVAVSTPLFVRKLSFFQNVYQYLPVNCQFCRSRPSAPPRLTLQKLRNSLVSALFGVPKLYMVWNERISLLWLEESVSDAKLIVFGCGVCQKKFNENSECREHFKIHGMRYARNFLLV